VTLYDCTFILNPQLEETGLDSYIKDTRDLVGRHSGKVVSEKRFGMRRLAYEIQKLTQGYYVSFIFEGNGDTVRELERHLRLDENCLRFLTCLAPRKVTEKRATRETPAAAPAEAPKKVSAPEVSEKSDNPDESN
jgi:small subunit ribosomal protein S6